MTELAKQDRLNIYKEMLVLAEKNLENSIELDLVLLGWCSLLKRVCSKHITQMPELMGYKPLNGTIFFYWFDISNFINGKPNTIRIDLLKRIIKEMEENNDTNNN